MSRASTRDAVGFGARFARGHGEQERIVEQRGRLDLALVERQRQQHRVERAANELIGQDAGLRLAQFDAQVGKALLQRRQDVRQHIGRERRDHAEPQPSGEQPSAVARELGQVARGREHALGAAGHLRAGLGQNHLAGPPLDQVDAEVLLQLADLHRKRRLGDGAGLRGLAEMPVLGERGQISQLFQGDHADKII